MAGDVKYLFDATFYLSQNPDVREAGVDAYEHYLNQGWKEGRDPNAYFDSDYYLMANGDVAKAGINPLLHFWWAGAEEGRAASVLFDSDYYLSQNTDVQAHGINPLLHFMWQGSTEMRDPNAFFDMSYYLEHRPDIAASGVNPLAHFLQQGWREYTDPSRMFDTDYYLQENPDVEAAGINPLVHWLTNGVVELRNPSERIDLKTLIETDQPFQQAVDIPHAKHALSRVLNHTDTELGIIPVRSTSTNYPPSLEDVDHVTFAENTVNAGAQIIDADVTFSDGGSLINGYLRITYTTGGGAEDSLSIQHVGTGAGQIGFDGTNVSYEGKVIGIIDGGNNGSNGNDLRISFTGEANEDNVETLIEHLTYANSSDTPTASRTLEITVNDYKVTGDPAYLTLTVTAENDPPVNDVPGAQVLNEDSSLTFNSANGNLISVSDLDSSSLTAYTLTVTQGTLTLSGTTGLSFSAGDGTADATMTFSGTLSAINTALDGLVYTPTADYNGADTLTLTANDSSDSDTDAIALTVNNVNDAPTLVATVVDQFVEVGNPIALDISGNFTDGDPGDTLTYSALLSDGSGLPAWLSLNASTGVFSGTPAGGDKGHLEIDLTADDGNGGTLTTRVYIGVNTATHTGTTGDDTVTGSGGADVITSGEGDDVINAGNGNDTVYGGSGNDTFDGGYNNDLLFGGSGDDSLNGSFNIDTLYGGDGNDILDGGYHADVLYGGDGNDSLNGSFNNDTLYGDDGNDTFLFTNLTDSTDSATDLITDFTQGEDVIQLKVGLSGIGTELDEVTITYEAGPDQTVISANNSTFSIRLSGNIALTGTDFEFLTTDGTDITTLTGNDTMTGTTGADYLNGYTGDDVINAGDGNDTVYGGSGNDTFDGGYNNDLLFGGNGDDSLNGSFNIDTLYGGDGNDILDGGYHADVLYGGDGNDSLNGSFNNDTLYGDDGNDTFLFTNLTYSTDSAQDLITDYTDGDDKIDLSGIGGLGFGDFTISLVSGNTLIDHNASTFSILLTGDHTGVLDAGDFIF